MAVYNGFSTRKKEGVYNELTFLLMKHLQDQIYSGLTSKECDTEKWGREFKGIVKRMDKMEQEKFMPPKYTVACAELINQLGIKTPVKVSSPEKDFPNIQGISYLASVSKLLKKKYLT